MKLAPVAEQRPEGDRAPKGHVLTDPRSLTPVDPQRILIDRGVNRPRRSGLVIPALIVLGLALEALAPVSWKPSQIAGNAAARFYFAIMTADNVKHIELVEMDIAARILAEREAEFSAWKGRCRMAYQFDPQVGAACGQAADSFYRQAIEEARRARSRLNTGELQ